jgi:hypothetical protein
MMPPNYLAGVGAGRNPEFIEMMQGVASSSSGLLYGNPMGWRGLDAALIPPLTCTRWIIARPFRALISSGHGSLGVAQGWHDKAPSAPHGDGCTLGASEGQALARCTEMAAEWVQVRVRHWWRGLIRSPVPPPSAR